MIIVSLFIVLEIAMFALYWIYNAKIFLFTINFLAVGWSAAKKGANNKNGYQ